MFFVEMLGGGRIGSVVSASNDKAAYLFASGRYAPVASFSIVQPSPSLAAVAPQITLGSVLPVPSTPGAFVEAFPEMAAYIDVIFPSSAAQHG